MNRRWSVARLGHRDLCNRRSTHRPWACHRDFENSAASVVLAALESLKHNITREQADLIERAYRKSP